MPVPDQALLARYLDELSWLRSKGERFAHEHPEVARKLELDGNVCPDPHVERLIESFAFLTARIQSDLADDFPEIAAELLGTLYPHFLNPIPSMTIVRFDPKPELKPPPGGYVVKRDTPLFAETKEGDVCRFRTCYRVELWPIEITAASVESRFDFEYSRNSRREGSVLRLRLRAKTDPFEKLGIDTLRLFLESETLVNRLYALLLGGDAYRVAVVPPHTFKIPDDPYLRVAPVGFGRHEDVIEYPRLSHPAYRLLQEYFTFEPKFHFVDVKGLSGRLQGKEVDLLFLLDDELPQHGLLRADDFVLGCTPAINLFPKVSEPIRIDQRAIEYLLVPDYRRRRWTAIHSIHSISGSSNAAQTSREYAPFYSFTHHMGRETHSAFWHARREGDDMYLSFRDTNFDPSQPADEVVYAHLLCTNGSYAAEMPAGQRLQSDQPLEIEKIVALNKPTPPLPPPSGGELLWQLVSHLSLNYLSLGDGDTALRALREILHLYCPAEARAGRKRIDAISRVSSRKVTRRVASSWNGFARGTEISLVFKQGTADENFLFASVLSHFFGLHTSINSFSQLVVRRDDAGDARVLDTKGVQWPIMPGVKAVL